MLDAINYATKWHTSVSLISITVRQSQRRGENPRRRRWASHRRIYRSRRTRTPRYRWALHRRACSLRRTTTPRASAEPRTAATLNRQTLLWRRTPDEPNQSAYCTITIAKKDIYLQYNIELPCLESQSRRFRNYVRTIDSSFAVIHKVGNVDTFVLLKFETKWDWEINHFNFNSEYKDKCKFDLKLSWYLAVLNLFQLEVVRICQCCQLCVLRENSI